MNSNRKCSERMRTILQAMERSIDAARRSRMKIPAVETPHQPQVAAKPATFGQPAAPGFTLAQPSEMPRLKARPKRSEGPMMTSFQPHTYGSQAG